MHIVPAMERREIILLATAVLIALLARLPGVWWSSNFPPGWFGHHPDEYTHVLHAQRLINRYQPAHNKNSIEIGLNDPWAAGYGITPYPKGLAVHVAAPMIAARILSGTASDPPPPSAGIIPAGRVISALYGAATVVTVFLLARLLFSTPAVPLLAAWIMALGGLHVSQSHFFLSDVPALFWFLLGLVFLWRDQASTQIPNPRLLAAAAFCLGIAFGMKLLLASVPSLGIAVLMKPGRIWRAVLAVAFFQFGVFFINAGFYTPLDFYETVFRGISDPHSFSRLASALLYVIQLPAIVSFPLFLASAIGSVSLAVRLVRLRDTVLKRRILIVIALPLVLHLVLILFKLDHFPRHLTLFIPWIAMSGAWALKMCMDYLYNRMRIPRPAVLAVFFAYLAVFVYDGEKGYIQEPRNGAARWVLQNIDKGSTVWWYYHSLPGYKSAVFPDVRPDVIVEEMHHANHYLSGMGLRNSLPKDYRNIFDSRSQQQVDAFQSLFTGETEYREAARYSENYFMPEYTLTDRLIGNRSRNYLAEVVVFVKTSGEPDSESGR